MYYLDSNVSIHKLYTGSEMEDEELELLYS